MFRAVGTFLTARVFWRYGMKPKLKTTLVEFMLVVPALALFILFVVYPLIGGIYYSFTSWNGIDINIKFVGFKIISVYLKINMFLNLWLIHLFLHFFQ